MSVEHIRFFGQAFSLSIHPDGDRTNGRGKLVSIHTRIVFWKWGWDGGGAPESRVGQAIIISVTNKAKWKVRGGAKRVSADKKIRSFDTAATTPVSLK